MVFGRLVAAVKDLLGGTVAEYVCLLAWIDYVEGQELV